MQRYISKDLTHFVGASLQPDEERQYLLFRHIIQTGILKSREYNESGGSLLYASLATPNALGEPTLSTAVCFCDIPVADLQTHSKKYSRFGLSFRKEFLVKQGANPIFYVAKDSLTLPVYRDIFEFGKPLPEGETRERRPFEIGPKRRYDFFEFWRGAHHQMCHKLESEQRNANPTPYEFMKGSWWIDYSGFVNLYVFGFVKYIDVGLADDDPKNFYMEREWRLLNCARFKLEEIVRVLLPESFARRFRADFGEYCGQLTFID